MPPPASDLFRRLLDSGVAFTQMTQQRAEAIVRDLVRAGEVQSEQTAALVQDIVDRSRQNTEQLLQTVRTEIRDQVASLGLATSDEVQALRREVSNIRSGGGRKKAAGKKKATAKKAAPRKKKAAGTRAAAKKA
jgi:polyhydroxyalkanoate synthesis regulator phasin